MYCSLCDKQFKSVQGLLSHNRWKHDGQGQPDPNAEFNAWLEGRGPAPAQPDPDAEFEAWLNEPVAQDTDARWRALFESAGVVAEQGQPQACAGAHQHCAEIFHHDKECLASIREYSADLMKLLWEKEVRPRLLEARQQGRQEVNDWFMSIPAVPELRQRWEELRDAGWESAG